MSGSDDGVRHFENSEPDLLSEILHDELNINYENFKSLIKLGAIYINNNRQIKDRFIFEKSVLRIHTQPRRFNCGFDWKSLVVYENEFFLVLNKPSGVPSHPSVDNVIENAMTQTSLACQTTLFVTHRLDTLTSGLIVYGKKKSFVKDFNIQMIERTIQKKYAALVESHRPLPLSLVHYMDPAKGVPKKLTLEVHPDWDLCKLEILEQKQVSASTRWVKINLLTGRTHQIRSQLAFVGAPVIGDYLYGAKQPFHPQSIALRSCAIEFKFQGKVKIFALDESFN